MAARVFVAIGTRPEVIKLAPVIRAIDATPDLRAVVCATAQHREMLDLALDVFGIAPQLDLGVMQANQQLSDLSARLIQAVGAALRNVQPDMVLVQGDTTTAMATALAAFYEGIPVGHVEAGLRTGNMQSPFPEEMNRRFISSIATLHFAPTVGARDALVREGVPDSSVLVTGNTGIDALLHVIDTDSAFVELPGRRVLVTAHRRESFGPGFESLCEGLSLLAQRNPLVDIVYPVHLNPRVQAPVRRMLSNLPNVHLGEPLNYLDFVRAMRNSTLILTDSGGVQEEAPSLAKPVLVLRETTERPEAVDAGAAILVGTDPHRIVCESERLLYDKAAYDQMASINNPFGDGHASRRIVQALSIWLGEGGSELHRHADLTA